jgi:protein O-GlcNAc transferase
MIEQDFGQWLARGRAHQQAGRSIDAVGCYRRALKSNAYSTMAQLRLGEVLRDLGRYDEARAAWQTALALSPGHGAVLLNLAAAARRAGAHAEAIEGYRRVLAAEPQQRRARVGLALSKIALGDPEAYAELSTLFADGTPLGRWDEVVRVLSEAPPSAGRTSLLLDLAAARAHELPPLLVALAAKEVSEAGEFAWARDLLARVEPLASTIEDLETLRLLAVTSANMSLAGPWAERYAQSCAERVAGGAPVLWPRRTAGAALRLLYVVAPGAPIAIGSISIELEPYLRSVVAAHTPERIEPTVCVVSNEPMREAAALESAGVRVVMLGARPDAAVARLVAEIDGDALIDLAGMRAPIGTLLAQKVARTQWSCAGLTAAHVAPLVTGMLPAPAGVGEDALKAHRAALEAALLEACGREPWFAASGNRSATELAALWRTAVAAHQAGEADAAIRGYREVIAEQPEHAPPHYLLGVLLRDRGERREAEEALRTAVEAAPSYVEARVALANLYRENGHTGPAIKVCKDGIALSAKEVTIWRALGLARLAQRYARLARKAFRRALALAPLDAETHYNEGVALQMLRLYDPALRAYQRALALNPALIAADFNIGVIFRDQGQPEAAVKAFEQVLAVEPRHVPAHKALAETLLGARRLDDWYRAFDRFEIACPDALPLAVLALQVCQYRGDFAKVEHYLERLQKDEFKATSETELADCLEELLFLLLYFDLEPDSLFGLYEAYDAVVPRVYGLPMALAQKRRPGKIRIGYLSGDLRNHVMGKMMLPAIERHDSERFELFFYSLSTASDEWTERYRALPGKFVVLAQLPERDAAKRILADDLDILVDLATNTQGSKPGILARKPARVQITHVASAGVCGLSAIDFKLTDAYADLPENQKTQIETLLPMDGCVYPYRHIEPAKESPVRREDFGIEPDAVVLSAFVNPLKLSRRCLGLWRQIIERVPSALIVVSPISAERRAVVGRLLSAAGIPHERARILPQGRDDAENQARYSIVDMALDPMPYGGANGTLEALDMGVPVVTLLGRRHGERSSYSILANLGVTQTVAASGSEYVDIAVRLATDPAFMAEVRGAIRAGLERSVLTDMDGHARALERAYLRALELRFPAALAATAGDG